MLSSATLTDGIYGDNRLNTEDTTTLRVTVGIVTNEDADEKTVYDMTKTLVAGVEGIRASVTWLAAITPKAVVQDINIPGAIRAKQPVTP